MFRNLGAPEIILILVVLVLLFGAKRLPDAARSLGRSMRIFKSEVKEMGNDDDESPKPSATPGAAPRGRGPGRRARARRARGHPAGARRPRPLSRAAQPAPDTSW